MRVAHARPGHIQTFVSISHGDVVVNPLVITYEASKVKTKHSPQASSFRELLNLGSGNESHASAQIMKYVIGESSRGDYRL